MLKEKTVEEFMEEYKNDLNVGFADFCCFIQRYLGFNKSQMALAIGIPKSTYGSWANNVVLPVKSRADIFKRVYPALDTVLLEALIDEERGS